MSEPVMTLLNRIKNLRQFEVEVDLPEGFAFHGVIPFDMTISQSRGKIKVFASSLEDATNKVNAYIQRNTEE
jgi:hypothetical protein